MYTQIFFVTSVRGNDFAPQMAANSGLRVFGAKMPLPAFFIFSIRCLLVSFVAHSPCHSCPAQSW